MVHQLTLTGTKPMLMCNIALGDPDNEYARDIARLNAMKSKITDEQRKERDWLKFRGGLYYDDKLGPFLPADNVFRSIQQAAALTRDGKNIERGLIMLDECSPLKYRGPREAESLYGDGTTQYVDRRMAKINQAPVVAIRPRFPEWTATFDFELDEDILSLDDLIHIAEKAGRLIHIGTYRRFFGFYSTSIR